MSELSYEQKQRLLQICKPEKKDILLLRLIKGEKIDITRDEDLFFQVNKDRVSLEDFTARNKFKESAEEWKNMKAVINPKHLSKEGKMRLIGEIPAEIYFSRPEFSPLLDKKERDSNIRKWLNMFKVFKTEDKVL